MTKAAEAVLKTWFDDLQEKDWFMPSEAVDSLIKTRHLADYQALSQNPATAAAWLLTPDTSLAAVLVLDQFPRNIFRGNKQSFAADWLALDTAQKAIALGHDLDTPVARRVFYYLPYEHSETLADQEDAVRLIADRANIATYLKYAESHRDIIRRFGRFPHRNAILGRSSTPEEIDYLSNGGETFGTAKAL